MRRSAASRALLVGLFAVPCAFVVALIVREEGITSTGGNFAVLGSLTFLLGAGVAAAHGIKRRCPPWREPAALWALAATLGLAVVFAAGGLIDFRGFAGGGH